MDYKDIDKVIESQVKFVKENSNSVDYRIQILNSLLDSIKENESKIYDALKEDLWKTAKRAKLDQELVEALAEEIFATAMGAKSNLQALAEVPDFMLRTRKLIFKSK